MGTGNSIWRQHRNAHGGRRGLTEETSDDVGAGWDGVVGGGERDIAVLAAVISRLPGLSLLSSSPDPHLAPPVARLSELQ